MKKLLTFALITWASVAWTSVTFGAETELKQAVEGEHRSAEHKARDQYRNPIETLEFLEVEPDMAVVEIWPGGGWYTEILAPYLRDNGKLYVAHFEPDSNVEYFRKSREKFMAKLENNPEVYDQVEVASFHPPLSYTIAPPQSMDRVLTFRNFHNWYMRGGDEAVQTAFAEFYSLLKPGGVLGVIEHRLPAERPRDEQKTSGYMHEAYIIEQAQAAGFELADSSEINANPKDTADHPEGVWSLPPTLREGTKNREHYLSVGESDRMTLKFVKPAEGEQEKTD